MGKIHEALSSGAFVVIPLPAIFISLISRPFICYCRDQALPYQFPSSGVIISYRETRYFSLSSECDLRRRDDLLFANSGIFFRRGICSDNEGKEYSSRLWQIVFERSADDRHTWIFIGWNIGILICNAWFWFSFVVVCFQSEYEFLT